MVCHKMVAFGAVDCQTFTVSDTLFVLKAWPCASFTILTISEMKWVLYLFWADRAFQPLVQA